MTATAPTAPTAPTATTAVDLTGLAEELRGRLVLPADPDYPALSTPWNVARASAPVAVAEVADADDVATSVRFAAHAGLDVAVQCTGHGALPYARPTLLIVTSRLDELDIRADGTARVGSGVRWGAVLDAAGERGLGALAGSAPDVGVVGYLTGGGLSPVARTFGWGSDTVTSFDVVTGDGQLRRASATENPALFWGLRGGKGTLGIVTAVEFDLLPVAEILGGCLYFDGADAETVVRAWATWSDSLPEQGSTSLAIMRLPDAPFVPPPLAGRCTVAMRFAWVGETAEGAAAVAPMQQVAPMVLGGIGTLPFAQLGSIHTDPVDPMPVTEHATLLRELPPAAVDALLASAGPQAQCPQVIVELRRLGGALSRPGSVSSAVCHRDAAYTLMTIGLGVPPVVEAADAHGVATMTAMAPWSTGGGNANFAPASDAATAARNYDPQTLERLGSLSRAYDPAGLLTAARSVRAATSG